MLEGVVLSGRMPEAQNKFRDLLSIVYRVTGIEPLEESLERNDETTTNDEISEGDVSATPR